MFRQMLPPPKNFANIYEYHLTRFINNNPGNKMVTPAIALRTRLRKDIEVIHKDNDESTIKTINDSLDSGLQANCNETVNDKNINSEHMSVFCEYLLDARFEYLGISIDDPNVKTILGLNLDKLRAVQQKTILSSLLNKAKITLADAPPKLDEEKNNNKGHPVDFSKLLTTLNTYLDDNYYGHRQGRACAEFLKPIFENHLNSDAQKLDALKLVLNGYGPGQLKLSKKTLGPAIKKNLCDFFKITTNVVSSALVDAAKNPVNKHKPINELEHQITMDLINAAIHREEVRLQREHLLKARVPAVAAPAPHATKKPLGSHR